MTWAAVTAGSRPMMMMIPEAWEAHADGLNRRAFYEYHAAMMELWMAPPPWVFTDGCQIGATGPYRPASGPLPRYR